MGAEVLIAGLGLSSFLIAALMEALHEEEQARLWALVGLGLYVVLFVLLVIDS